MALPRDLLQQAKMLTQIDPRRPKQVNLRRAVSAAYYAAFHLLAFESASQTSPTIPLGLKQRVLRALSHTAMKEASKAFVHGNYPRDLAPLLSLPMPLEIGEIARLFVELQGERHKADYDLAEKFDRSRALASIQNAELLFGYWSVARDTQNARVFLASLMFHKMWNK